MSRSFEPRLLLSHRPKHPSGCIVCSGVLPWCHTVRRSVYAVADRAYTIAFGVDLWLGCERECEFVEKCWAKGSRAATVYGGGLGRTHRTRTGRDLGRILLVMDNVLCLHLVRHRCAAMTREGKAIASIIDCVTFGRVCGVCHRVRALSDRSPAFRFQRICQSSASLLSVRLRRTGASHSRKD